MPVAETSINNGEEFWSLVSEETPIIIDGIPFTVCQPSKVDLRTYYPDEIRDKITHAQNQGKAILFLRIDAGENVEELTVDEFDIDGFPLYAIPQLRMEPAIKADDIDNYAVLAKLMVAPKYTRCAISHIIIIDNTHPPDASPRKSNLRRGLAKAALEDLAQNKIYPITFTSVTQTKVLTANPAFINRFMELLEGENPAEIPRIVEAIEITSVEHAKRIFGEIVNSIGAKADYNLELNTLYSELLAALYIRKEQLRIEQLPHTQMDDVVILHQPNLDTFMSSCDASSVNLALQTYAKILRNIEALNNSAVAIDARPLRDFMFHRYTGNGDMHLVEADQAFLDNPRIEEVDIDVLSPGLYYLMHDIPVSEIESYVRNIRDAAGMLIGQYQRVFFDNNGAVNVQLLSAQPN